ncbi:hypothetical protein L7F22_018080 [Adiantum nelumboides]|nr:hypothetical protein [Adiantum nelumboides]
MMGVARPLLLLCSLSIFIVLLALSYTFSSSFRSLSHYVTTPGLHCFSAALQSWAPWRPAELKAKLTPSLLFLLLNLVVGAILLSTTGFLRTEKEQAQQSNGDLDLQSNDGLGRLISSARKKKTTHSGSTPESSARRSTLQAASTKKQQLDRSKSDKALPQVPALAAPASPLELKPPLDPSAKKKRRKKIASPSSSENASSISAGPGRSASNLKEQLAPTSGAAEHPISKSSDGDRRAEEVVDEDQVDRRAEEFIANFYMQMRMQRLASLERHHQRLDRSYGR